MNKDARITVRTRDNVKPGPRKKFALRARLFHREGGRCHWCRRPVRLNWPGRENGVQPPDNGVTIDHIVPFSEGGTYSDNNTVCSCYLCNNARLALSPSEFESLLKEFRK
jgi:hypothetical protein